MLGAIARGTTDDHASGAGRRRGGDRSPACGRSASTIERRGPAAVRDHGRGWRGPRGARRRRSTPATPGTTMRLLAGMLAGCPFRIDADRRRVAVAAGRCAASSIRSTAMGARIGSDDGRAPLDDRRRRARPASTGRRPVASAQVKSAILLAGLPRRARRRVDRAAADARSHGARVSGVRARRRDVDGTAAVASRGGQAGDGARRRRSTCPATRRRRPSGRRRRRRCPGRRSQLDGVCLNPHRLGFVRGARAHGRDVDDRRSTGEVAGEPVGTHARRARRARRGGDRRRDEVPGLIDELPVLAARAALGGALEVSRRRRAARQGKRPHHGARRRASARSASTPTSGPTGSSIDGVAAADRRHGRCGGRSSAGHGLRARRRSARRGPTIDRRRRRRRGVVSRLRARPGGARRVTTDKIYLVGFMASGKSTIARALAARLRWRAEDIDDLIERRERRTIAEIFAQQGEPYFRAGRARDPAAPAADAPRRRRDRRRHVRRSREPRAHQPRRRVGLDRRAARRSDPAHPARRPPAARRQPRAARAAVRGARRRVPAGARARRAPRACPSPAIVDRILDAIHAAAADRSSSPAPDVLTPCATSILSDIHAQPAGARRRARRRAAVGYDAVLVLGDLVGYGADPGGRDRSDARARARGDHSRQSRQGLRRPRARVALQRRRARVDRVDGATLLDADAARRRCADLPKGPSRSRAGIEICHGAPFDEDYYVFDDGRRGARDRGRARRASASSATRTCRRSSRRADDPAAPATARPTTSSRCRTTGPVLINVGSVGQPRDGDPRAAYGVLDLDARHAPAAPRRLRHRGRAERNQGDCRRLRQRLATGRDSTSETADILLDARGAGAPELTGRRAGSIVRHGERRGSLAGPRTSDL